MAGDMVDERVIRPVPPFDLGLTLGVYASFRSQMVEMFEGSTFLRLLAAEGVNYLVAATSTGTADQPEVRVDIAPRAPSHVCRELTAKLRWLMSADEDLAPFYQVAADADPVLLEVVRRLRGLRPPRTPSVFEALIIAISEQQMALAVASTMRGRLVVRFGQPCDVENRRYYQFPTADALAHARPEEIRALGFSTRKAGCMVEIAQNVCSGEMDLEALRHLPPEAAMQTLTRVSGIGRWTVEYMMCRGMGRYDVLPANDAGLKAAVSRFYRHGQKTAEADVRSVLQPLGEMQGLAAFYLIFAYAFERYGLDPRTQSVQRGLI